MKTKMLHKQSVGNKKLKVFPVGKSFRVKSLGVVTLLAFTFFFSTAQAQESVNATGGDASGSGGTFSYSFGQFACQNFFEGNSSVSQGVQHPFEFFGTGQSVPQDYQLVNATLTGGEILCYNALETITVAGNDGTVEIQPNATAEFIAGQSIRFLPGFHAQAGSFVQGRISTTGDFCDGYIVPSIVHTPPIVEKSIVLNQPETHTDWRPPDMGIKVYPNPNNGRFIVELVNIENKAQIYVYNQLGSILHHSEINNNGNTEIELPNARGGLYFVRVVSGVKYFVNKIIVN
jgi:hypothetical protein